MEADPVESFEHFRRSFSYGSRSDLNFKFLKNLDDAASTEFLRVILDLIGDSYDTGDLQPLIDIAIDAQIDGYRPDPDAPKGRHAYDTGPFAPTPMPVAGSTIGLVTSSGHFIEDDDPEPFGVDSMTQDQAIERISEFLKETPVLSEIPSMSTHGELRVRHGGYDITSANIDPNVCFPIDRLNEAAAEGRIGAVTDTFFSFPGATAQGRLRRELPGWMDRFDREHADAIVLVPV